MSVKSIASNPLRTVLRNAFAACHQIRVMDYQNDFSDLWGDGLHGLLPSEITGILICGTDPPTEVFTALIPAELNIHVTFADHFTAYSWAAAFRLLNPGSSVKLVIINDFIPYGTAADLVALFARDASCASPVVPGIICLTKPSLSDILAALSSESPRPLRLGQQAMLRGIIQQHLIPDPDKHHQLGNVVGSLMLTAQAGTPELGKAALAGLLQSLQPATEFRNANNQPFECDQTLIARIARGVPFVLFDDMGEMWKPFVHQWVPDALLHIPPVSDANRNRLLQRLHALASQPVQKRQLNAADFGAIGVPDREPFILLLDLRLFAPSQANEELNFIDKLGQFAEEVRNAENLKWPTISKVEVEDVLSAWTDRQSNKPNYRKARSWLPKLISLIDPTLPIVIFSSTQDPEVLKEFRPHGNIVADFAKPVFRGILGEATEWIGAAHRSFESALQRAVKIRGAQAKIIKICFPWIAPPGHQNARKHRSQVEIYLDESGTAAEVRFAVGAVVLISGGTPFDHRAYRTAALLPNGVGLWGLDEFRRYTHINQFPPAQQRLKKGKDEDTGVSRDGTDHNALLNTKLSGVQTLVSHQDSQLIACSLLSVQSPDLTNVASIRHPYHRYRDMMGRLLESILLHCDSVRHSIECGAKICIDAATAKNNAANWNSAALAENFGAPISDEPDNGMIVRKCRTLAQSDVLPILTGILLRNGREGWANQVVRARAVQLSDFVSCSNNTLNRLLRLERDGLSCLDPKPLHYLADWIAHFTYDNDDWIQVPNIPILKHWFRDGFSQPDNEELRQLLRCHRRWSQAAKLMAVGDYAGIAITKSSCAFALNPRLEVKAAHWMAELTAHEINSLFQIEEPE